MITQLNLSACQLFGYDKQELIGKSVSVLLPHLFRNNHTQHVIEYLKEKINSKITDSKRITGFALNKMGYIFSLSTIISFLPSLTMEPTLALLVKKEIVNNYVAHIFTSKDYDILCLSKECLRIFQIKEKYLTSIKNFQAEKAEDKLNIKNLLKDDLDGKTIFDLEQEKTYEIRLKPSTSLKKSKIGTIKETDIYYNPLDYEHKLTFREIKLAFFPTPFYHFKIEIIPKHLYLRDYSIPVIRSKEEFKFNNDLMNIVYKSTKKNEIASILI